MKRLMIGFCTVALMVMLGAPASAHRRVDLDPDDSPGKLDIVAVVAKEVVKRGEVRIVSRLVTYEAWDRTILAGDTDDRRVRFEFRKNEGSGRDRGVLVFLSDSGKLVAQMYWVTNGQHRSRFVKVWRPDSHSVSISFPKRLLGPVDSYRWRGITAFGEEGNANCPPTQDVPGQIDPSSCPDRTRWLTHEP